MAWNVQKALAQEIEKAFPFDDIPLLSDTKNSTQALFDSGAQALDRLLNQLVKDNPEDNLDLYGLRGSEKCGPIGDLAQHWKKKDRENYFLTVIRRFSVKQSGKGKSTPLPKTPQTKEDYYVSDLDEDEDDFDEDKNVAPTPEPKVAAKKPATPKRKDTASDPLLGSTVNAARKMSERDPNNRFVMLSDGTLQGKYFFSSLLLHVFYLLIVAAVVFAETIYIDIRRPERTQYPFKLKTAANLEGTEEKTFYHGHLLEMRVHPCDALGQGGSDAFDYQASLMASDTLLITAPILHYTDRGQDDEEVREYLELSEGEFEEPSDEVTMEAFDNHRNTLDTRIEKSEGGSEHKEDKELAYPLKKQHKLVFINGEQPVHLSSDVLKCHEGKNNKLQLEALPIEYEVEKMNPSMEDVELNDLESVTIKERNNSMESETKVWILPRPTFVLQRFIIRLADLNKDVRKKGRIVKPADVDKTIAMMSALNKKKGKKKKTGRRTS